MPSEANMAIYNFIRILTCLFSHKIHQTGSLYTILLLEVLYYNMLLYTLIQCCSFVHCICTFSEAIVANVLLLWI